MTPQEIRRRLNEGGWTLKKIGALAPGGAMSDAIISRNIDQIPGYRSHRAQAAIAAALGLSIRDVFGSRAVQEAGQ